MKKFFYYGILIFIFSIGIGYYYSSVWKNNKDNIAVEYISQNQIVSNITVLETVQIEEKVSHDASFALRKYYDECGHSYLQDSELPPELINLTQKEVEELYSNWEVEEFSSDSIVLCQEVNNICNQHFFVKLGKENVEVYQIGNGGSLDLYLETEISREYLTNDDIENLETGFLVYSTEELNSKLEDFE